MGLLFFIAMTRKWFDTVDSLIDTTVDAHGFSFFLFFFPAELTAPDRILPVILSFLSG